jgi:phosphatidylserine decarboxylase
MQESPVNDETKSPESPNAAGATVAQRAALEPMDPAVTSIQPGGGWCMRLELGWGYVRRFLLKLSRPKYLKRMQGLRQCEPTGVPHEVLDPRDMKFYVNQGVRVWAEKDDPFAWRERLGFVRDGLAELVVLGGGSFAAAGCLAWWWWPLGIPPLAVGLLVVWFFRNPSRQAPTEPGLVVAPADGRVVEIDEVEYDPFVGGPAVRIGIFLSVFNVHINRTPVAGRVVGLTYRPGKFLNALQAASARENEQLAMRLEENVPPYRRFIVRQIAGLIARRIVCLVRPGDELQRGARYGMIKLGSRTELVLPREPGLRIEVTVGRNVQAGSTVMARYEEC